jgi:DNA-binding CsgD family transcriptional regulator
LKCETLDEIYYDELTPRQKKLLSLFLEKISNKDIAFNIGASERSTITHHIKNICDRFCCSRKTKFNYREHLLALLVKYKLELVSNKLLEKHEKITNKPQLPEKPKPINSP